MRHPTDRGTRGGRAARDSRPTHARNRHRVDVRAFPLRSGSEPMQTPLHPMVVHLPMALSVLMPVLAGILCVATWRGWLPGKSWLLVIAAQALLVGSGFVALRTGEHDEDRVERVVAKSVIHEHEEAAEVFVDAGLVALGIALLPMFLGRSRWVGSARLLTLFAMLAVSGLGYRVGKAGGALVYEHGAAAAFAQPAAETHAHPAPETRRDRHDDDR
ncbi:MAG TPA: DUF2231 domain-containing protein [Planctomycetota bacterium]|nr:DUF2231 domain-containing protein [Planctomycetota bacterium]